MKKIRKETVLNILNDTNFLIKTSEFCPKDELIDEYFEIIKQMHNNNLNKNVELIITIFEQYAFVNYFAFKNFLYDFLSFESSKKFESEIKEEVLINVFNYLTNYLKENEIKIENEVDKNIVDAIKKFEQLKNRKLN